MIKLVVRRIVSFLSLKTRRKIGLNTIRIILNKKLKFSNTWWETWSYTWRESWWITWSYTWRGSWRDYLISKSPSKSWHESLSCQILLKLLPESPIRWWIFSSEISAQVVSTEKESELYLLYFKYSIFWLETCSTWNDTATAHIWLNRILLSILFPLGTGDSSTRFPILLPSLSSPDEQPNHLLSCRTNIGHSRAADQLLNKFEVNYHLVSALLLHQDITPQMFRGFLLFNLSQVKFYLLQFNFVSVMRRIRFWWPLLSDRCEI